MKSKSIKQSSLYIPLADIVCKLSFDTQSSFIYFKKRFYSLPSIKKSQIKIVVLENETEFIFHAYPNYISCRINKSSTISLEEVYFIITALMQYQTLSYDILLLHASSCIKNNKAYLFMAPSGSGKSTIINSFTDESILSDDVAVLQKKKNIFQVFTSPLDNKKFKIDTIQKSLLHKIYFLKQASFTKVIKRDTADGLLEILHNNLLFWLLEIQKQQKNGTYVKQTKQVYNLGLDLLRSSQVETLYFTKDLSFLNKL